MKLLNLITELNRDEIYDKYVVKNKVVTRDEFVEVETATKNKLALTNWMLKKIEQKMIKTEDIYKWYYYLKTFNRRKRDFPIKDIGQIKTRQEISAFIEKAVEIESQEKQDPSKQMGVAKSDKYKEFRLGDVDGFEVYKLPKIDKFTPRALNPAAGEQEKEDHRNKEAERKAQYEELKKAYYGISCDLGSGTQWCTATGRTNQWFEQYIHQGPLYIFINPKTGEKYQFHYESGQFMDKNDQPVRV